MFLYIFGLLLTLATSECTDEFIVSCAINHIDLNDDNAIDASEIDHFLIYNNCKQMKVPDGSGQGVIADADSNNDGVITSEDVNEDNFRGILAVDQIKNALCNYCTHCPPPSK